MTHFYRPHLGSFVVESFEGLTNRHILLVQIFGLICLDPLLPSLDYISSSFICKYIRITVDFVTEQNTMKQ